MKLAEALILRSDLQKRISQLESRISNNVTVQEGDEPVENPNELLTQLDRDIEKLIDLIQKINRTNNQTMFDGEHSLADMLARREGLWKKRQSYSNIANQASFKFDRYSKTEIKNVTIIDVANLQEKVDGLSRDWRQLDTKIQALNWTVDLVE